MNRRRYTGEVALLVEKERGERIHLAGDSFSRNKDFKHYSGIL